jgi:hypothetical protein
VPEAFPIEIVLPEIVPMLIVEAVLVTKENTLEVVSISPLLTMTSPINVLVPVTLNPLERVNKLENEPVVPIKVPVNVPATPVILPVASITAVAVSPVEYPPTALNFCIAIIIPRC